MSERERARTEGPADGQPTTGAAGSGSRRGPGRSRWLAIRVLLVQVVTLIGLWLLQAGFGSR